MTRVSITEPNPSNQAGHAIYRYRGYYRRYYRGYYRRYYRRYYRGYSMG